MNYISKRTRCRSGGFTLMEAVFTIMIVGLGVVALMQVFASGTNVNDFGNKLSTAVFLAGELRSMTDDVDFVDLPDFDGSTYSGVDSNEVALPGMQDYQQVLAVEDVNPVDMTVEVGGMDMYRLTATVTYKGQLLSEISWLRSW